VVGPIFQLFLEVSSQQVPPLIWRASRIDPMIARRSNGDQMTTACS
jgi:hypothetical protein